MRIKGQVRTSRAFALPTVLIASVVLLAILAVSVTATATVRETLKGQYYAQLAQVAGESGVAYAKACLAANGNVPSWTDAKPLTPATDCSGNMILSPTVRALVIGGGGAGGGTAGGGGAGGYQYADNVSITATAYPITVGAGGAATGNCACNGNAGGNSVFSTITAIGGGGGGTHGGNAGGAGGSGGGGGMLSTGSGVGGAGGIGSQGNNGGLAPSISGWTGGNGGGGGAGGAGGAGGNSPGVAAGGAGLANNITGSMIYYAAGGGGGEVNGSYVGTGGSGIGGSSVVDSTGSAGAANTGSGGGGGSYNGTYWTGGAGGSGVVIIAFPTDSGILATGGTVTNSGGYEIHKFTASGTFNVTSIGDSSCPSDPKCSVTVNDNIRSSFSVPKPTVDSQGRAVTIPNSGYVEVLRTSNGSVWRTYKQPSVQAAVVPDLCSGNATAARGWTAAVKSSTQDNFPTASSAQTITLADTALYAGQMYFRKDFNVGKAGTFALNILTSNAYDTADAFIDSQYIDTSNGSLAANNNVTLTPGCHTLMVRLTQGSTLARTSYFTLSLTQSNTTVPTVVSDTSWRVSEGDPQHFSQTNYYESPKTWDQALDMGGWNNTTLPWGGAPSNWVSVSGDTMANYITTKYSTGGTNRPGDSYAWFRQTTPFTLTSSATVRVSDYCDDKCDLYLDGQQIMAPPSGSGLISKSITIQAGTHTFGVRLYNNAGANIGAFIFAAYNIDTNTVVARSDAGWDSTNFWTTGASSVEPYSYDKTFLPNPNSMGSVNVKALVVAGGGAGGGGWEGGGGGAGGLIYDSAHSVTVGTYPITVGAGGAGGGYGSTNPGGSSLFDTIRAVGGGYGTGEPNGGSTFGLPGGSGGGGSHPLPTYVSSGAFNQGNAGGSGLSSPTGIGAGGGGAGGVGQNASTTKGGDGGVGVSNSITGSAVFYAGGGGGAFRGGTGGAGGNGGGGAGTTTTGVSGTANTGGGGGAAGNASATGISGSGGSGVVIIAFPTGSMTVTTTGATKTVVGGFDIYRFTTSGTFTVVSIP